MRLHYVFMNLLVVTALAGCSATAFRQPGYGAYMGDINSAKAAQCVPYAVGEKNVFMEKETTEAVLFLVQCDIRFTKEELQALKTAADKAKGLQ